MTSIVTETTLPTADPALSALNLLDNAGYTAALGEPVAAVEDDGGLSDPNGGYISVARVATVPGNLFEITLQSYATEAEAMTAFQQRSSADGSTPLAGVGDEAMSSISEGVVRKGAQLLLVSGGYFTDELEAEIGALKESGGDTTALIGDVTGETMQLVAPLAAKLSGQASTSPVMSLPAGAIDQCLPAVGVPALIEAAFGATGVQARYESAAKPPGATCVFQPPDLPLVIVITTVSDAQLAASVNPDTSGGLLQANAASHTGTSTSASASAVPGGQFNSSMS